MKGEYIMKRLYKSKTDKKICGVCGGLAEYLGIDPTIVRLIWAILVVFFGTGILIYIIAALVLPERPIDEPGNVYDAQVVDEPDK